jgi:hypothetical protein
MVTLCMRLTYTWILTRNITIKRFMSPKNGGNISVRSAVNTYTSGHSQNFLRSTYDNSLHDSYLNIGDDISFKISNVK